MTLSLSFIIVMKKKKKILVNHALQEMAGNSLLYPNLNSLIKLCCAPEILESRSHHVYHL